jgi:hypothetical protein
VVKNNFPFLQVSQSVLRISSIFEYRVRVKVFNATFNNISVIPWPSVLLVEENGVPGENYLPVASH